MFPLADERGRVLGFGARAMRRRPAAEVPQHHDNEVFHKGRIVYGADLARAAAAKAGRVVLVEGYTDVIALHQAGVPEAVGSMGTALTDEQVGALARLAPTVLFCQDPDAAGQKAVDRGSRRWRANRRGRTRRASSGSCGCPPGSDPADVVAARRAPRRCAALLERAVPLPRFQVERALERGDPRPPRAATRRSTRSAAAIAPLPAVRAARGAREARRRPPDGRSALESRVADPAPRRGDARPGRRAPPRGPAARQTRAGQTGPARTAPATRSTAASRPSARSSPTASRCPTRASAGSPTADLDELFARPLTRRAAEYLRGRLRTPAADLPAGDEPLARLVAELVIRAGQLEATPAKLELEALQLDLSRLDRLIADARVTGERACATSPPSARPSSTTSATACN